MIAMVVYTAGGPGFMPVVRAQTAPVGAGFELDAGDLRFIYRQILIAQAHAAGGELFGPGLNQVPEVRQAFGLRTVDGSFNHLEADKTAFGAADQLFPRLATDPVDGVGGFFRAAEGGTSYTQKKGTVIDSQPRIISNLIADQTDRNPVAAAVVGCVPGPGCAAVAEPLGTLPIPNVASDVGLSAPFNTMFTFFGQFFDHGLDLVTKGGGTVFVPLQEDDPLFVAGGPNFMTLTRATNQPGPDGVTGDNPATPQDESADDIQEATNTTTPFVDQNQTYTSHPSHQVFLREYELNAAGRPVSTGRMIDGGGLLGGVPVKNIGNWAEVKAQAATMLGIQLVDADVFNVPLLAADPYGRFLRGVNGFPQIVTSLGPVEGDPAANGGLGVLVPANAVRTGHAFLDDIAHNAAPKPGLTADADDTVSVFGVGVQPAGTYDDELLDRHFVTGDGRGNENIALTSVHTVFHAEHNRLRDNIAVLINGPAGDGVGSILTADERAQWNTTDLASGWDYGEHLFQAARFVTEMEYQHLVFEEFARKLAPSINPFIGDGINFQSDTNPAISAEFAHQVYRLGHSMLNETVARTNHDGSLNDIELLDAFLNPLAFNDGGPAGPLTAAQAAGAVFQGGTRQVANEIDEFVTEAVRNRLLGLPLDLAVFNLSRGRSEGIPPLNEVRRQVQRATGDPAVTPYTSWFDYAFSMRHPESLINFIAAYGTHPTLAGLTAVADKRAAAELIVNGGTGEPADRFDFLFSTGAWTSGADGVTTTGVDVIDLWIGGLAEKQMPFGGLLGSTFNHVFEIQMENLQNADRFYYLERLDGLNLLAQMEANSFGELISRNTTLNGANAADVFARPDLVINLAFQNLSGPTIDDPNTLDFDESVELVRMPDGTIRYNGGAHVIWNGRDDGNSDRVFSSEGDDTLRGNGGNDVMEGGSGNDQHIGGFGDDILTDIFGEDVLKGGPGNDAISGGLGLFDLLQGNEGHDFILAGNDVSETFGGPGNDVMYTGDGGTEAFGGAGDDWIEGGPQLDLLAGDENNQFQNDPNQGHDVIIGGKGDDDYDSEGGDDIMVGDVLGTERFEGMLGFDWVTYRGDALPVDADMNINVVLAPNLDELRDRFDLAEALSGYNKNDLLRGTSRVAVPDMVGHELNAAGIARVTGLSAFLNGATSFTGGEIIMGGAGSDLIEGRGGDDFIDGDAWLNVQLRAPNPATADPADFQLVDSLHALKADVFAGRINPGDISIVRSIVTTGATAADVDTAVFSGNFADYTITVNANGTITVEHNNAGIDGIDTLRNIELLVFADRTTTATGGVPGGVAVPQVAGLSQANASAAIVAAGLIVGTITTQNSNTVAAGIVLQADPLTGVTVTAGSAVNLIVSLGPLVPDVHDHTVVANVPPGFPAAQDELAVSGLTVGIITLVNDAEVEPGLVVTQDPLPGGTIAPGGAVNLFVSSGPAAAGTVPAVVGLLQADAEAAIGDQGLVVGAVTSANSATFSVGRVISTSPVAGTSVAAGSAVNLVISLGPIAPVTVPVPSVVGSTQAAATLAITNAGLGVALASANSATVPSGSVISQTPAAGTPVTVGSVVGLIISIGPLTVPVPNVVGATQALATSAITGAGLTLTTTPANSATVAIGSVISQAPGGGTNAAPGSNVALVVSVGALVPNVVGGTQTAAATAINGAGLTASSTAANSTTAAIGSVLSQAPTGGTNAEPGSNVALVVSAGALVPGVVGGTLAAATTAINAAGLAVTSTTANDAAAAGSVISQAPLGGTNAAPGSSVALVVSLGPVVPPPPPPPPPPAAAGLVLALGFDEPSGSLAFDTSGGSLNGTILGALRVPGQVGGALQFDGINDWVTVPDAPTLDLTTGMTVEAWIKPAVANGWDTVVMKERGAGDFAYGLYANDGAPLAGGTAAPSGNVRASGGHRTLLGTSALASGVWTHVATTYDGTTQRLFINGVEVSSRAQVGTIAVSAGVLRIGGNSSFAGEFFEGAIDDVRVYNRALNAAEIAADMSGTPAPPPPPPPPPPPGAPAGLVLSLNFDEASGDATDASGNGHVGTILGAARVAGVRGNALSFDGIDDKVTVPDGSSLDLTTGLTVQAWVKPEALNGWDTVVMKERGAGDFSYGLYANDGAPLAGGTAAPSGNVRANNGHRTLLGTSALATGVWTHVATTYDGTTQRLFINGVEVSSRAQAGAVAVSDGLLAIGGNGSFAGEFYNGLIDEVRVYNRALSSVEIAADKDR